MADDAEVQLVCDFRAIYHLSWWEQVESGVPSETEALVEGLKLRHDSLYRALAFASNPPPAGTGERSSMTWFGWSQETALLLDIRNMLAPKQRLHPPPVAVPNQPTTELEVLQGLRVR